MDKILIIEDEDSILMPLEDNLRLEGYNVSSAKDGLTGLSMATEHEYSLIILDIMLPKIDGFEICKKLRQSGIMTPILILTAKSNEIDKILGLELGADDYITKPFSPRELLARIKAILRRMNRPQYEVDSYQFGDVEVDFKKCEATKSGQTICLTALEFTLLNFLIKHKEEVVSRDDILDAVWGEEVYVLPRAVDTHVAHLRKKIEKDPANPKYLKGIRGIGYKFTG